MDRLSGHKKEYEEKQRQEQIEWDERQAEMLRIIKRSVDEDPLEIISNLNQMMGIKNPPGWFSDKVALGDTTRYKFIEDDHVDTHAEDKYYLRPVESDYGNFGKNRGATNLWQEYKLNDLYVYLD